MKVYTKIILFLILLSPCLIYSQLRFANGTTSNLTIAIGYNEGGTWYSDGWWSIGVGQTKTVYTQPLSNKYEYYFYAYQSRFGKGGVWSGKDSFCAPNENFKLLAKNCDSKDRRGFKRIELGTSTNYTLTLTSSEENGGYPMDQAPIGN